MVEGGAEQLPEDEVLAALKHAHAEIQPIIDVIDEFAKKVGKPKLEVPPPVDNSELALTPMEALAAQTAHTKQAAIPP